ncbi:hypothetical protein L596_006281 [Steinernema carpocapsae]|uniref:Uncharacterized protein n=1 Tax=Steinernema carpocapsae TaxID=34508 RepID=A0A4U8V9G7_STECR|nr:hypothetical protein L596_006281 [Steinernema carpocapsae]
MWFRKQAKTFLRSIKLRKDQEEPAAAEEAQDAPRPQESSKTKPKKRQARRRQGEGPQAKKMQIKPKSFSRHPVHSVSTERSRLKQTTDVRFVYWNGPYFINISGDIEDGFCWIQTDYILLFKEIEALEVYLQIEAMDWELELANAALAVQTDSGDSHEEQKLQWSAQAGDHLSNRPSVSIEAVDAGEKNASKADEDSEDNENLMDLFATESHMAIGTKEVTVIATDSSTFDNDQLRKEDSDDGSYCTADEEVFFDAKCVSLEY